MQALEYPFSAPPAGGELKDVAPGIKWLRMPLPYALDHINLYLVRDGAGWMIVDSGLDTAATQENWERILAQLPADQPITGLLCTHYHNDHAGAAGWLTGKLNVPLHMSMGEYFSLRAFASADVLDSWEYRQFYQRLGFSEEQIRTMIGALRKMRFSGVAPQSYRRLRDDQTLRLADSDWRVITGAGHSPEHASLFSETLGVLICGDQLLPRISANVSVNAVEPEADPLHPWLESLDRIGRLPADTLVLPSHDLPYRGLQVRARELRAHHEQHLQNLHEFCAAQPGSAYQLMQLMFPRRKSLLDDFLAVSECLAHLSYLYREGRVTRELRGDVFYYSASGA